MAKEVGKVWEVMDKRESIKGIYMVELGHMVKLGDIWKWNVWETEMVDQKVGQMF